MEKKARVISEHKGAYKVKNENGEFLAKVTGKKMFNALSREDYPAVGDWVLIDELPEEQAVIREILPRNTIIKRKSVRKDGSQIIATNIDVVFVVESVGRDYNLNRFERYFAIARDGGIKPAIIINKIDLISSQELGSLLEKTKKRFPDVDVLAISIVEGEGIDELKSYMQKDKTYCFLGSSGVGKSSLINKLLGKNIIRTENISISTGKGKHTTTNREMYFLENGAIVIDNPGMREIGMTDTGSGIDNLFDDITILAKKCKYTDCTHIHEKGCAVLDAVKLGKLDKEKYLNYINLKKESEFYEMSEMEKRQKDKDFGKFIKKAKKELKDYGAKG
jgi:ribosome biogenesis GTPase